MAGALAPRAACRCKVGVALLAWLTLFAPTVTAERYEVTEKDYDSLSLSVQPGVHMSCQDRSSSPVLGLVMFDREHGPCDELDDALALAALLDHSLEQCRPAQETFLVVETKQAVRLSLEPRPRSFAQALSLELLEAPPSEQKVGTWAQWATLALGLGGEKSVAKVPKHSTMTLGSVRLITERAIELEDVGTLVSRDYDKDFETLHRALVACTTLAFHDIHLHPPTQVRALQNLAGWALGEKEGAFKTTYEPMRLAPAAALGERWAQAALVLQQMPWAFGDLLAVDFFAGQSHWPSQVLVKAAVAKFEEESKEGSGRGYMLGLEGKDSDGVPMSVALFFDLAGGTTFIGDEAPFFVACIPPPKEGGEPGPAATRLVRLPSSGVKVEVSGTWSRVLVSSTLLFAPEPRARSQALYCLFQAELELGGDLPRFSAAMAHSEQAGDREKKLCYMYVSISQITSFHLLGLRRTWS